MNQTEFKQFLSELEIFGKENDQHHTERAKRMLNITPDTGEFLTVLIHATQAKNILEIGTSNGYSTLWLAQAAKAIDAKVTTIEFSKFKADLAQTNFNQAGLSAIITLLQADAYEVLQQTTAQAFELVFLDAKRSEYVSWWPEIKRILKPNGLLIVDNATSHATEMNEFMSQVCADASFSHALVPVGNGQFLASKLN